MALAHMRLRVAEWGPAAQLRGPTRGSGWPRGADCGWGGAPEAGARLHAPASHCRTGGANTALQNTRSKKKDLVTDSDMKSEHKTHSAGEYFFASTEEWIEDNIS